MGRNREINVKLDDVNDIISNLNISSGNILEDYIKSVVNKRNDLFLYIENAYKETYLKYGKDQADIGMERYILNGITKHITNNNNSRDDLINNIDHSKIFDILKEGLNIDAYCSLEELCDYFIDTMGQKYNRSMGSY